MPVIPATQEAEVGGSRCEANPGKVMEILSQKQNTKKTQKSCGHGSSSRIPV
jgi:hypothetical protein